MGSEAVSELLQSTPELLANKPDRRQTPTFMLSFHPLFYLLPFAAVSCSLLLKANEPYELSSH